MVALYFSRLIYLFMSSLIHYINDKTRGIAYKTTNHNRSFFEEYANSISWR